MLIHAISMDPYNQNQKLKTSTGVKDTFLQFFIDKLEKVKRILPAYRREQVLQAELGKMPKKPYNPVWRLKGMFCDINIFFQLYPNNLQS